MPPPSVTRSWLKSTSSKPGVFSSALNSVFTPLMNVNGYLLQLGDERREVARVGDQDVARSRAAMNSRQFAVNAKM